MTTATITITHETVEPSTPGGRSFDRIVVTVGDLEVHVRPSNRVAYWSNAWERIGVLLQAGVFVTKCHGPATYGHTDYVLAEGVAYGAVCEQFARCGQPAEGVTEHAILGLVPSCARCAARLERELLPHSA